MTKYLWIVAISLGLVAGCTPKDESASGGGEPGAATGAEKPAAVAGAPAMPAAADLEKIAAAGPVEIGCAMCVLKGPEVSACTPAVKLGETVLLLTGYESEEEHALCSGVKMAKLEGKVEDGKFVATKVELVGKGQ